MQNAPRSFQKFKKVPMMLSLLFLIASIFVFMFIYGQINNNKKIADEAQASWQAEAERREEVKSLDRLLSSIAEEKFRLESHFVPSSNIVPFLDTIEGLGNSAKVSSEVVSVNALDDKSGLMLQVRAGGSFEAVYKFLTLLENSPYELEFLSADIQQTSAPTTTEEGSTPSVWEGNFEIKLLSFIP